MPQSVLDLARKYLSSQQRDFESLLQRLEGDLAEAKKAKHRAEAAETQAQQLAQRWRQKLEKSADQLLDQVGSRIKKLSLTAQDEIQDTLKRLKEGSVLRKAHEAQDTVKQSLEQLQSRTEELIESADPELGQLLKERRQQAEKRERENQDQLGIGSWVRVPQWRSFGEILEVKGSKSRPKYKVRLRSANQSVGLTLQLAAKDLHVLNAQDKKELAKLLGRDSAEFSAPLGAVESVADQLDLRGQRFEEAMQQLELYLDQALRAGKLQVRIIHGLGRVPYVKEHETCSSDCLTSRSIEMVVQAEGVRERRWLSLQTRA